MALLTSLYLCSRTVYAAVGTPTGSGARVVAAAQTELPEGWIHPSMHAHRRNVM